MHFFLSIEGQQQGPFSAEEFGRLLNSGAVAEDAQYWYDGCESWLPVTQHPDFVPPFTLAVSPPPTPPALPASMPMRFAPSPSTSLTFCPDCGQAVSKSAPLCPSCGKRLQNGCLRNAVVVAAVVGGAALLFVVGGALLFSRAERPPARIALAPGGSIGPGPTERQEVMLPASERAFVDALQPYVSRYMAARNELQKSALRVERARALANVVTNMQVTGWIGTLKQMKTYPDGKASVAIQLDDSAITVHTDLGKPFDRSSDTSIEQGSPLYDQISALAVGDKVVFGGSFLPGERYHLKETSLTEAGAMTEPEFVMRFSDVTPALSITSTKPSNKETNTALPRVDPSPKPPAASTATETPSPVTAGAGSSAAAAPSPAAELAESPSTSSASPIATVPPTARAVVADFYAWYLREIREGRQPWLSGELAKRPEISRTFAVRISYAKEPEPAEDPVFTVQGVPSSVTVLTDRVNALDATVATRLTFDGASRLVNVRLSRADALEPWQIDDVQPRVIEPSTALSPVQSNTGPVATGAAPTPRPVGPVVIERLLIGKWQGSRHLTEYRADHTRVMDGVDITPARTWQLDGDRLRELPGKSVYRVISLDQKQLVLEGDLGTRYLHVRVGNAAETTASAAPDFTKIGNSSPISADVRLHLKLFEDEGHTCHLLLPEDGWIPVENLPPGVRLAVEGPGGVHIRVRPLNNPTGARTLAVMFAMVIRDKFPLDDMVIQPKEPEQHPKGMKRTIASFHARSGNSMQQLGNNGQSPEIREFNWNVISEGSATWIVEIEQTIPATSSAEIKAKPKSVVNYFISNKMLHSEQVQTMPLDVFYYIHGFASGYLESEISQCSFDAEGLTPITDAQKRAKELVLWNDLMDMLMW